MTSVKRGTYERPLISDMRKMGEGFKNRRKRLNLSQTDLAVLIGIAPRKYGYFEAGRARLSLKQIAAIDAHFERIEQGESFLKFRPLNLLQEDEFLSVQQRMLSEKGKEYDRLWLFGVRHLPVLKDIGYQLKWVENLNKNISYNLIMVLDKLMDETLFQLFQNTISEICQKVNGKAHGEIKLYGLTIGKCPERNEASNDVKSSLAKTCEYFENWKAHFGAPLFKNVVKVNGPIEMSLVEFEECRSILHYGWLRSVVCYQGKPGVNTFAASFLDNISNNPKCSGEGESGWTFLSPTATAALSVHIREFANAIERMVKSKT